MLAEASSGWAGRGWETDWLLSSANPVAAT